MTTRAEYNRSRNALIEEQIKAFRGFQEVYRKQIPAFLSPVIQGQGSIDVRDYISSSFGVFNAPFQRTAVQLSEVFYEARRQQAGTFLGRALNALPLETVLPEELIQQLMYRTNPVTHLTKVITQAQQAGTLETAAPQVAAVSSQSVGAMERESFLILGDADNFSESSSRRARSSGCAFCKLVTASASSSNFWEAEALNFHNNCSCIFDSNFSGEPDFQQSWAPAIQREAEEATLIIESGEAGTRVVQVGSREWNASKTAEITSEARIRHELPSGEVYTPPRSPEALERQQGQIQGIVRELKGRELSPESQEALKQWGYEDPLALAQPYDLQMNTPTPKNISMVMQALEGERNLKNIPEAPVTL